jgi:hypothetical protein
MNTSLYRNADFAMLSNDNISYDKKLSETKQSATPSNLKQGTHGMVDEHSSTPFSKNYALKPSNSVSGRKSTNVLTDKDLG